MDAKTFVELFNDLGWKWTAIIFLGAFAGGAFSHYVFKLIDINLERKSKISEEIREIKRKRYEEFVEYIEKLLARKPGESDQEHIDNLNLIYSKMSISVPENIVKLMTKEIDSGKFDATNRTRVYLEIRKDLLGKADLEESDLRYWSLGKNKPST